jgi:hypothetical protein
VRRFRPGPDDGRGNPADGWGPPRRVAVFGWGPPAADREPFEQGRSEVARDLDLYAPPGVGCGPRDRWLVAGGVWEQVGWAEDFTSGPFGFAPGARVSLRRVEG